MAAYAQRVPVKRREASRKWASLTIAYRAVQLQEILVSRGSHSHAVRRPSVSAIRVG
jgi:hypothetical protein